MTARVGQGSIYRYYDLFHADQEFELINRSVPLQDVKLPLFFYETVIGALHQGFKKLFHWVPIDTISKVAISHCVIGNVMGNVPQTKTFKYPFVVKYLELCGYITLPYFTSLMHALVNLNTLVIHRILFQYLKFTPEHLPLFKKLKNLSIVTLMSRDGVITFNPKTVYYRDDKSAIENMCAFLNLAILPHLSTFRISLSQTPMKPPLFQATHQSVAQFLKRHKSVLKSFSISSSLRKTHISWRNRAYNEGNNINYGDVSSVFSELGSNVDFNLDSVAIKLNSFSFGMEDNLGLHEQIHRVNRFWSEFCLRNQSQHLQVLHLSAIFKKSLLEQIFRMHGQSLREVVLGNIIYEDIPDGSVIQLCPNLIHLSMTCNVEGLRPQMEQPTLKNSTDLPITLKMFNIVGILIPREEIDAIFTTLVNLTGIKLHNVVSSSDCDMGMTIKQYRNYFLLDRKLTLSGHKYDPENLYRVFNAQDEKWLNSSKDSSHPDKEAFRIFLKRSMQALKNGMNCTE